MLNSPHTKFETRILSKFCHPLASPAGQMSVNGIAADEFSCSHEGFGGMTKLLSVIDGEGSKLKAQGTTHLL